MRRRVVALAATIVAVLAADAGVLLLHDPGTPYGVDQAVSAFRAAGEPSAGPPVSATRARTTAQPRAVTASSASPAATRPPGVTAPTKGPVTSASLPTVEEGVYRYQTTGHEQVDVLGGSRHDYPAETAITYRRGGCGDEDRWQPLEERYSSNIVCRGPRGLEARSSVQRRQFFHESEEQDLACDDGIVLVPKAPRAGQLSSGSCRSDDTVVRLTIRVRDVGTTTVGGRSVRGVHVSVDGTLTGATRGTTHRDEWFDQAGLLLRGTAQTETDRDTQAGVVHYSEVYELRLESLAPQR